MKTNGNGEAQVDDAIVAAHRNRWRANQPSLRSTPSATHAIFENRICFTISEVAHALGLSAKSVERLIKRGELRVKRAGRRVLVPRSDIEAWLNQ